MKKTSYPEGPYRYRCRQNTSVKCCAPPALKGFRHSANLMTLILCLVTTSVSANDVREWQFQVFLDDKPIGQHHFRVTDQAGLTRVNINADFKVRFLFITAYRYTHENQEVWRNNCLLNLQSSTYDNGNEFSVSGRRQSDAFVLRTQNGEVSAPPCVMSFAYWNPVILKQTQLVNPQTGEYLPVNVEPLGERMIQVGGVRIDSECFDLKAREKLIKLCYDRNGHWVALESESKDGRRIRYQLRDWPQEELS